MPTSDEPTNDNRDDCNESRRGSLTALLRVCLLTITGSYAGCALEPADDAAVFDAAADAASDLDADGGAADEAETPRVVTPEALVANLASPACTSYTEYLHHTSGGIRHWTRLPTVGFNTHIVVCTLRRGSSARAAVRVLQASLRCSGQVFLPGGGDEVLAIDGVFGGDTEGALRRFQAAAQIQIDGVFGPETASRMNFATFRDSGVFSGCERD